AQPIADRTDDAVAHHQHDKNEKAADDDLPPLGELSAKEELSALDQKSANEGADQGAAPAHRSPNHALNRKYRPGIEIRDDAHPGGVHGPRGSRHEGGNAKHENAIVGDVITHEFRAHVIVTDRL